MFIIQNKDIAGLSGLIQFGSLFVSDKEGPLHARLVMVTRLLSITGMQRNKVLNGALDESGSRGYWLHSPLHA
jgi:hypothetical protein